MGPTISLNECVSLQKNTGVPNQKMAIISLLTDFGQKDHHVAAIKANLIGRISDVRIIDISHDVEAFDLMEAAYILEQSVRYFPRKSVHIIGVDSIINSYRKPIIAEVNHQYFISANNGLLGLCFPDAIGVVSDDYVDYNGNFPVLDVFCQLAIQLIEGIDIQSLGILEKPKQLQPIHPAKHGNRIIATVIYVDHFGNLVLNITKSYFQKTVGNSSFNIDLRGNSITDLVENYQAIVKNPDRESAYHGRAMALFNAAGYLEIAIYKSNPQTVGSASTLFGYKKGDIIGIEIE